MTARSWTIAAAFGLALALLPAQAAEKTGTQMLFDTEQIADITAGKVLDYSHTRTIAEEIEIKAIDDGTVKVALFEQDGKRHTVITLNDGTRQRTLEHMPGDRGNPVFIVFLESVLTTVTRATGGSPFYLRNRFKDALGTGGVTERTEIDGKSATRITYMPFAKDKHRDRLGAFADLRLSFALSDAVPGRFLSLSAEARSEGKISFGEYITYRDSKEE